MRAVPWKNLISRTINLNKMDGSKRKRNRVTLKCKFKSKFLFFSFGVIEED